MSLNTSFNSRRAQLGAGGTVTITGVNVNAATAILVQRRAAGGVLGFLTEDSANRVPETAPGAGDGSVDIVSSNAGDTSEVEVFFYHRPANWSDG
jgi:hypothetical protein